MKLTLKTDYALRTLIFLGSKPESLASIAEVAQFHRISENHLIKVVHELGRKGFIKTLRGKGGGISITEQALQATIGDVVRAMEDDLALVACFKPQAAQDACELSCGCHLQAILFQALTVFMSELDKYRVADLLRPSLGKNTEHPIQLDALLAYRAAFLSNASTHSHL